MFQLVWYAIDKKFIYIYSILILGGILNINYIIFWSNILIQLLLSV